MVNVNDYQSLNPKTFLCAKIPLKHGIYERLLTFEEGIRRAARGLLSGYFNLNAFYFAR
jgi:hypothetical protein